MRTAELVPGRENCDQQQLNTIEAAIKMNNAITPPYRILFSTLSGSLTYPLHFIFASLNVQIKYILNSLLLLSSSMVDADEEFLGVFSCLNRHLF